MEARRFEERRRGRSEKKVTYDIYEVDASGHEIGNPVVRNLTLAEALRITATLNEWNPHVPRSAATGVSDDQPKRRSVRPLREQGDAQAEVFLR